MIVNPDNARDPWMPDAAAIAGAKQGFDFLKDLVKRRMPANDSLSMAGIRRTIWKLSRIEAQKANQDDVIALLGLVPESPVAAAIVNGIEQGWPADKVPTFDAAQRLTLGASARGATGDLQAAFGRLAARWQTPDLFRAP
jgi:hypothetical protein